MKTFLRFLLRFFSAFGPSTKKRCARRGRCCSRRITSRGSIGYSSPFASTTIGASLTSSHTAQSSWFHRKLMTGRHAFPVETDSPYAVKHMAEYLQSGGKLVLFPEGRLSQTGSLMKLFDGTGFLLFKTDCESRDLLFAGRASLPLSPQPGWKKFFPRVSAHFSDVLTPPKPENVSTDGGATKGDETGCAINWSSNNFGLEMEFGHKCARTRLPKLRDCDPCTLSWKMSRGKNSAIES